jgi:uncharacterized membrane protein
MDSRTLRIALAVSVVLNLFAIGALAGGAVVVWSRARSPTAAPGRPLRRAADALPPQDQQRFRQAIRDALADAGPIRQAARENRRAAADLLVQPTFDAAKVNDALAQARQADFALRTRLEGGVVDFARSLPQSERVALARGLAQGGPLRLPAPKPQTNQPPRTVR